MATDVKRKYVSKIRRRLDVALNAWPPDSLVVDSMMKLQFEFLRLALSAR